MFARKSIMCISFGCTDDYGMSALSAIRSIQKHMYLMLFVGVVAKAI